MVGRVVMGPVVAPEKYDAEVSDLNLREICTLAPLAVACLVLGLYPTPVLRSLEPSIELLTAPARTSMVEQSPAQKSPAALTLAQEEVAR